MTEGPLGMLGGMAIVKFLFRSAPDSIPICHTKIVRGNRGLPWDKLVGVHPTESGETELKAISAEDNVLPEEE